MKNLVSSYTRLLGVVYSGEVRGEVGTRSRMCCVGWVVWVHGFSYYIQNPFTHTTHPTQHIRDLVPTSPLISPLYTTHISRVQLLTKFFFISQPEDDQCKVPKHVVVLYVINYTHISTII